MKRWLGWMAVLGLGGALVTGCASQQEDLPKERRSAPLGVGGGPDVARKMAQDQLKNE